MKAPNDVVLFLFLAAAMTLLSTKTSLVSASHFSSSWSAPLLNNPWLPFINLTGCRNGDSMLGLRDLKQHLHHFGYLPESSNFTDQYDDELEDAVRTYQRNFGLNVTGELDQPTVDRMMTPRCGVPDVENGTSTMNGTSPSGARGRNLYTYFPGAPTWPPSKRELKYAIVATSAVSIDRSVLKTVFARAFSRWSAATTVTFAETDSVADADIKIGFYSGAHGDDKPFDGPLGVLAHAFAPRDGRFHLDAAETWVAEGDVTHAGAYAVDLESVAMHEIGHLLGLGHTPVADAIMYPMMQTRTKKVDLAEDVQGVQNLYGSNPKYNGATTPTSQEASGAGGVGTTTAAWRWWSFGWVLGALVAFGLR